MNALKRLEIIGKRLLAIVVALLLWRPGRKARALARLTGMRRVLLVRIDERVGEALLTTPLFRALKSLPKPPIVEVLVHPRVARVLEGHPEIDVLRTFDPRARLWGPLSPAIRALKKERFDVVVNCASWADPSVGPAIVSRLIGAHGVVVGPAVKPVGALSDIPVEPRSDTRHEARQRLHLLSPLGVTEDSVPLSFRPLPADPVVQAVRSDVGGRPYAVVNPGGRLGVRRVPPEVFRAAARVLEDHGVVPLVTWGPGEEALARDTAQELPGARIAPPTTIDQLAALMSAAALTVCNNTGPMHLSVAVGTPTLAFFLNMEMARWGHPDAPHRMVDLTPCADRVAAAEEAVRAQLADLRLDLTAKSP